MELPVGARRPPRRSDGAGFYAAFKVGEDDKHITSIDEDGVALAAIKALHAENGRLRRELAAQRAHDRRVDAELARIEATLRK